MKNPRKSPGITTGIALAGSIKFSQEEIEDYPFAIKPDSEPRKTISPDEESFRALLRNNLPAHTAPQALRDRIRRSIKNMPD
ncbi:MAG: hypothetical protein IPM98_08175 [Lewinellaceae bacterium]|nr:hypothetical protein [Lewinellaceae bacterium]